VWPPGAGLQGQASNHPMLLRSAAAPGQPAADPKPQAVMIQGTPEVQV
jgi:hypothetical protein